MRRFIALPVPGHVRDVLQDAIAPLHDAHGDALRWTRPEGWHVTLAFLGEVPDDAVDGVAEVIDATVGRGPVPATLRLAETGRFGRNVLWVGIADDPAGSVAALGDAVQQSLAAEGLPVQMQPVEPHVTLARSRRRGVGQSIVGSLDVPDASWPVEAVELWRSHLGDGPARYEVDVSVPLL